MDKLKLKKLSLVQQIFAYFLLFIGFLGVILPIMPGVPFIFIGLYLLGGIGLIDQLFLKYLPDKYRGLIIMWIETFAKKHKK